MPKLCFKVILTRDHFMKDHFSLSFHSSLFFHHFSFDSPFLLVFFFNIFVLFLLISIFQWGELNIPWNSNFSDSPSNIRHLTAYSPQRISFSSLTLPPTVGGDPWSGYWKKNYQVQKGWLSDNVLQQWRMMKDGHFSFQTQSPKLKSNSLQEKKWFVFL